MRGGAIGIFDIKQGSPLGVIRKGAGNVVC
jgi:hypothetical protein